MSMLEMLVLKSPIQGTSLVLPCGLPDTSRRCITLIKGHLKVFWKRKVWKLHFWKMHCPQSMFFKYLYSKPAICPLVGVQLLKVGISIPRNSRVHDLNIMFLKLRRLQFPIPAWNFENRFVSLRSNILKLQFAFRHLKCNLSHPQNTFPCVTADYLFIR